MICRHWDFIVYVENKVYAAEGSRQAEREMRDLRRIGQRMGVPRDRQIAVFLTPLGRGPVTGDPDEWVSISYLELADTLRKLLADVSHPRTRYIVEDWIDTVTAWRR
jgi:hypothetical protein